MRHLMWLIGASVVLVPGWAGAWEVGVKGAYWVTELSGHVRLDDGVDGTTVDLGSDLGVDDENFFFGEAWAWLGDHHLTLALLRVDYAGSETVEETIRFGGQTFQVGEDVDTDLEYVAADLAYQYDLVDLENVLAGFSLGPILQVKYLDGTLELRGGGREESQSFQIPLPMAGLGVHLGLLADILELRLRGVGMGYRGDSVLEAQGELSYNPVPLVEVVGGYRHFAVDVEEDDVLLDYTQTGPYVGASLKF